MTWTHDGFVPDNGGQGSKRQLPEHFKDVSRLALLSGIEGGMIVFTGTWLLAVLQDSKWYPPRHMPEAAQLRWLKICDTLHQLIENGMKPGSGMYVPWQARALDGTKVLDSLVPVWLRWDWMPETAGYRWRLVHELEDPIRAGRARFFCGLHDDPEDRIDPRRTMTMQ